MRQTIKEINVNLAYRWFLGLGFTDEVPHFTTFGKNYKRRFEGTDLYGNENRAYLCVYKFKEISKYPMEKQKEIQTGIFNSFCVFPLFKKFLQLFIQTDKSGVGLMT